MPTLLITHNLTMQNTTCYPKEQSLKRNRNFGKEHYKNHYITANGKKLETMKKFKYLRAMVSDEGSKPEVIGRIAMTAATLTMLDIIWKDKATKLSSKIRLMRSLVNSVFLYACKTWTVTAELEKRVQALEIRCFRRLIGISYKNYITSEEVKNRIKQASDPYEDLLSTIKRRKLIWFGHVIRGGELAKTVLQRTVKGGRKRGRQKKRWEDNIAEWTGRKLSEAIRHAEDKEKWRELVHRSSAAPQRQ